MVKITILHNELKNFVEEDSGVSFLIKTDKTKILFDVSYRDEIIKNALKKDISLKNVDYLILSHKHIDHTEGLRYIDLKNIKKVLSHPDCFSKTFYEGFGYIGAPLVLDYLKLKTDVILSKKPQWIEENKIVFLGEIPRLTEFESKKPVGNFENGEEDFVLDDSAIAIKNKRGLIIITGCSHSGICNIINYAKKVCNEERVYSVIGGFHLFNKEQTDKTVEFIRKLNVEKLYPMHCLNEYAFSEFEKIGGKRLHTLETIEL